MFKSTLNLFKSKSYLQKYFSTYTYQFVKVSTPAEGVGLIQLDRPKARNALSSGLMKDLNYALKEFEDNDSIGSIVLYGEKDYFAAGADIKEMKDKTYSEVFAKNFLTDWNYITSIRKPVIAAVNGYALGGGCELSLMCDIIIAGENALFGQPEIKIGTIPGAGGSQRLARIIGKSRTMEMVLTGDSMKANEALQRGLVSRVVPPEKTLDEAVALANKISQMPRLISISCKDVVNTAYETTLSQGLNYEKRVFWATFGTEDRKIGMEAFANKKTPEYKNN